MLSTAFLRLACAAGNAADSAADLMKFQEIVCGVYIIELLSYVFKKYCKPKAIQLKAMPIREEIEARWSQGLSII